MFKTHFKFLFLWTLCSSVKNLVFYLWICKNSADITEPTLSLWYGLQIFFPLCSFILTLCIFFSRWKVFLHKFSFYIIKCINFYCFYITGHIIFLQIPSDYVSGLPRSWMAPPRPEDEVRACWPGFQAVLLPLPPDFLPPKPGWSRPSWGSSPCLSILRSFDSRALFCLHVSPCSWDKVAGPRAAMPISLPWRPVVRMGLQLRCREDPPHRWAVGSAQPGSVLVISAQHGAVLNVGACDLSMYRNGIK